MFTNKDPNSITTYSALKTGGEVVGQLISDFQVVKYDQVQSYNHSSVEKKKHQQFLVYFTQRIIVGNSIDFFSDKFPASFNDYPVLFNIGNEIRVAEKGNKGFKAQLLDYSPKTINAQMQSTGTAGSSEGASTSNSTTKTSGHSTSETNSFNASLTLSKMPGFSVGGDHSSTTTNEQSLALGSESSQNMNQESSASLSMSIKDWGAYAYIDKDTKKQGWFFGQEYPWDSIMCKVYKPENIANPNNSSQREVFITRNMKACLYDGEYLSPPSHLSLYGVNFVMKALYLVTIDDNVKCDISIDQDILLYTASHLLSAKEGNSTKEKEVKVYLDREPALINTDDSPTINLQIMALDAIGSPDKPAIIGFLPNKFLVSPNSTDEGDRRPFRIVSTTNTLYLEDQTDYSDTKENNKGFEVSRNTLIANLSEERSLLSFKAYFKVVDNSQDYSLYFKHWKSEGSQTVKLTIVVNNDEDNKIVKLVEAEEAAGGEKNLLTLALRDQSYASVEHVDYLQLGLNSVEVRIEPAEDNGHNCGYHIRAISIE